MEFKILFPNGKEKVFIASYDDCPKEDRRLVSIFNKYGIKGTFHINSGKLDDEHSIRKDELKTLYRGHEISAHTVNHPHLHERSSEEIEYEVGEDRRVLESLAEYPVRGFSYPFGSYSDFVKEQLCRLGIEYARTVNDTHSFKIPDDFLEWHPTCHQNDAWGHLDDFLNSDSLSLFYIWGHSWELNEEKHWEVLEEFFKKVSSDIDTAFMTNIELCDYIKAYNNLKYSYDRSIVENLSAIDIFIKCNGEICEIGAGCRLKLK